MIANRFHTGQESQRHGGCGKVPGHLYPTRSPRPQDRRRIDQPAPAATGRRAAQQRSAHHIVRQTTHRRSQRGHRRSLDRQRTSPRAALVRRTRQPTLRDPCCPGPVLPLLCSLLGTRGDQVLQHHQARQAPVIAALQTGLTNARTEGQGLQPHRQNVGRIAFGFQSPDYQRRRIQWACTRQSPRFTPSQHQCHC